MNENTVSDSIKLFTAIHRLGRQMHRCAHSVGHADGYYREQSRLLMLIAENEGVIQRDLAEEMDVRPSSMTEMLSKMEQLGLIYRQQDERDQRVLHIFLTEQGKNAAKDSQTATQKITGALFGGLTDDEIKQMLALTEKLCSHLDAIDSTESNHDIFHHHKHYGGHDSYHESAYHHHGFSHHKV